jgi:hypothetical protein
MVAVLVLLVFVSVGSIALTLATRRAATRALGSATQERDQLQYEVGVLKQQAAPAVLRSGHDGPGHGHFGDDGHQGPAPEEILAAAEARAARAESLLAAAEADLATAERDRDLAQQEAAAVHHELGLAQQSSSSTARERDTARQEAAYAEAEQARLAAEYADLASAGKSAAASAEAERQELRRALAVAKEETAREIERRERAEGRASGDFGRGGHPGWRAEMLKTRLLAGTSDGSLPVPEAAVGPLPTIPALLSLSDDAVPDCVVDGANPGPLVVRAASTSGESHRKGQQHRRDAVLLRMPTGRPGRFLLSAVAAGAPDGPWSQSAAAHACHALSDQVERHLDDLAVALRGPLADPPPQTRAALRVAIRDVRQAITAEARIREWRDDSGDDARAVSTSLTAVLSPLDDGDSRTHLVFAVGDGSVLRLRDEWWEPVLPAAAGPESGPLPGNDHVRVAAVQTLRHDLLAVCTGPTAEFLLRPDVGRWFADRWAAGQPTLTDFLTWVNAKIPGAVEDRSLVCLWDFGEARDVQDDIFRRAARN